MTQPVSWVGFLSGTPTGAPEREVRGTGHGPADVADRIEQLSPLPQDDEDPYPHDLP